MNEGGFLSDHKLIDVEIVVMGIVRLRVLVFKQLTSFIHWKLEA